MPGDRSRELMGLVIQANGAAARFDLDRLEWVLARIGREYADVLAGRPALAQQVAVLRLQLIVVRADSLTVWLN